MVIGSTTNIASDETPMEAFGVACVYGGKHDPGSSPTARARVRGDDEPELIHP